MGTMLSTIHLKNQQQLSRETIETRVREHLQKKGWQPVEKNRGAINYSIVFSDGDWITLTSTAYTLEAAFEDEHQMVQELARVFNACCIQTTIYDSDILFLVLVDGETGKVDRVAVGNVLEEELDGSKFTLASGNQACWRPLLASGATWEQLVDTWRKPCTLVDDAFVKTALLLGMEPQRVMADYRYWEEVAKDDPDVTAYYYVL